MCSASAPNPAPARIPDPARSLRRRSVASTSGCCWALSTSRRKEPMIAATRTAFRSSAPARQGAVAPRPTVPLALALLAALTIAGAAAAGDVADQRVGEVLRQSVLRNAGGGTLSLAGLRGQVVVI